MVKDKKIKNAKVKPVSLEDGVTVLKPVYTRPELDEPLQKKAKTVEDLKNQHSVFLKNRLEQSTQKTYKSTEDIYMEFTNKFGLDKNEPQTLSYFMIDRTVDGIAGSTILKDARILQSLFPNLRTNPPLIKQSVMAVKKQAVVAGNAKMPITPTLMGQVLRALSSTESSEFIADRAKIFFTMAFRGCMRGEELTEARWEFLDGVKDGLLLFMPFSKPDPFGQGSFARIADSTGNLTKLIKSYRERQTRSLGRDAQFIFTSTLEDTPLSPNTFRFALNRALLTIMSSDEAREFSLHSFRRGSATELFANKVPIQDIMRHGRWKSDAVEKYIVIHSDQLWNTACKLEKSSAPVDKTVNIPASFGAYPLDDQPCEVCGEPDWTPLTNELLICDGENCEKMYHMGCLRPRLKAVPSKAWFCPCCSTTT